MATRDFHASFSGGELSPEMVGMIGDSKYRSGLERARNFICKPTGPAENRAGTEFVREVKTSSKRTRLIPFTYSTTQTMVIEIGEGYFRFHTQGATLLAGSPAAYNNATGYVKGDLVTHSGTRYYCIAATTGNTPPNATYWYALPASGVYEIPNPYVEAHLFDIHYVQSADVLTLVHPSYAPRELRRVGATNWQLSTISFAAPIAAPGAPTVTCSGHTADKYDYVYVVTAIAADGVSESVASSSGTDAGNLLETGGIATIAWSSVSGASRYNVYKQQGGLYGYIGQTTGTSIIDDNISPDLSKTPPIYETVFNSSDNYPAAVSYIEQRRAFGGTNNALQTFWLTRSGTESDMSYGLPVRDDDRIKYRIAAREANTIRHIVPLSEPLILTSSAEWRIAALDSEALTPSSVFPKTQSYVGASNVQPVIVNNTLIYGAARGGHVRELAYNWQAGGFSTGDLCLRAAHLFDNLEIVDMAYGKAPIPIVWFVSSNGYLLSLTYVPEQQIGAWSWHDTTVGEFESCAVVAEGNEDRLYVVVKREIDGADVRYVERLASRQFVDQEYAFFVDCGLTYDSTATDTISGLDHLEGEEVSILADGAVHPRRTVTGGEITLDVEASVVQIGLPIEADFQTLPLAQQIDAAYGQGRTKNVNRVYLRVYRSSGIFVGPDADNLTEAKIRTTEPYGSPPALQSREIEVDVMPSWTDSGQVFVRQSDPLPVTIVSLTAEVELGD